MFHQQKKKLKSAKQLLCSATLTDIPVGGKIPPKLGRNFILTCAHEIDPGVIFPPNLCSWNWPLESLEFLKHFDTSLTKFYKNKFSLIKLATNFWCQPRYFLAKTSPLILLSAFSKSLALSCRIFEDFATKTRIQ